MAAPPPPRIVTVGRQPVIDYLTKDYAGFRQAMLDQIPLRLPAWKDRSESDFGVVLIELFAYVADILSYYQDRVANEAYLATATQRRSLTRPGGSLARIQDEASARPATSSAAAHRNPVREESHACMGTRPIAQPCLDKPPRPREARRSMSRSALYTGSMNVPAVSAAATFVCAEILV